LTVEVSLMQVVERTISDLLVADLSLPISGVKNLVRLLKKHHPEYSRSKWAKMGSANRA
jgi:hypothetical protein